jgi:hypothetical protein
MVAAILLFAFFIPFIPEDFSLGVCTSPTCVRATASVSLTYRLFNIGGVYFGSYYHFWTSSVGEP